DNMRALIRTVAETGAELGIAFDGDADRIGVTDAKGRIIWGDELLVLFGRDVLARNPGAVIVSEVKCSQRLYDDLARHGGRGIMWKAGHSLLKAKMRETGALLGGEMSGHIFFKEKYFGYDDAIYAGARLLDILARSGKRVDQLLADLPPSHTTPEIRVDCPDDVKFAVAERVRDRFRAAGREIIDVEIPRDRLVVITGLSGSGKSSLAFDTLYAEGQRRYVESLSAYARQFLEQMEKPDCDAIEGLSPAIAIEAKGTGRNPRSTVGTVTEIADYLRLLYARVGRPLCYSCGREIAAQTVQQVVDRLTALPADTRLFVYAPVVRDRKG